MNKTFQKILNTRPWVKYIDDERSLDHGIIVTLAEGYSFAADPGCPVYGFDTVKEVLQGTAKSEILK